MPDVGTTRRRRQPDPSGAPYRRWVTEEFVDPGIGWKIVSEEAWERLPEVAPIPTAKPKAQPKIEEEPAPIPTAKPKAQPKIEEEPLPTKVTPIEQPLGVGGRGIQLVDIPKIDTTKTVAKPEIKEITEVTPSGINVYVQEPGKEKRLIRSTVPTLPETILKATGVQKKDVQDSLKYIRYNQNLFPNLRSMSDSDIIKGLQEGRIAVYVPEARPVKTEEMVKIPSLPFGGEAKIDIKTMKQQAEELGLDITKTDEGFTATQTLYRFKGRASQTPAGEWLDIEGEAPRKKYTIEDIDKPGTPEFKRVSRLEGIVPIESTLSAFGWKPEEEGRFGERLLLAAGTTAEEAIAGFPYGIAKTAEMLPQLITQVITSPIKTGIGIVTGVAETGVRIVPAIAKSLEIIGKPTKLTAKERALLGEGPAMAGFTFGTMKGAQVVLTPIGKGVKKGVSVVRSKLSKIQFPEFKPLGKPPKYELETTKAFQERWADIHKSTISKDVVRGMEAETLAGFRRMFKGEPLPTDVPSGHVVVHVGKGQWYTVPKNYVEASFTDSVMSAARSTLDKIQEKTGRRFTTEQINSALRQLRKLSKKQAKDAAKKAAKAAEEQKPIKLTSTLEALIKQYKKELGSPEGGTIVTDPTVTAVDTGAGMQMLQKAKQEGAIRLKTDIQQAAKATAAFIQQTGAKALKISKVTSVQPAIGLNPVAKLSITLSQLIGVGITAEQAKKEREKRAQALVAKTEDVVSITPATLEDVVSITPAALVDVTPKPKEIIEQKIEQATAEIPFPEPVDLVTTRKITVPEPPKPTPPKVTIEAPPEEIIIPPPTRITPTIQSRRGVFMRKPTLSRIKPLQKLRYTPTLAGIAIARRKGIALAKAPRLGPVSPARTRLPTLAMIAGRPGLARVKKKKVKKKEEKKKRPILGISRPKKLKKLKPPKLRL